MPNSVRFSVCVAVFSVLGSMALAQEAMVVDKKGTKITLTEVSTPIITVVQEKSVQSVRVPTSGNSPAPINQAEGFVAVCTDISGTSQEVFGMAFNFTYYYLASGNWTGMPPTYSSDQNRRLFLPVQIDGLTFSIPFTDIQSVRFSPSTSSSSRAFVDPAKAHTRVEVMTVQGKTVTGMLAPYGQNHMFTGTTEFGSFGIEIEKVASVVFSHSKDKNAKSINLAFDSGTLDSGYKITVLTWGGENYEFRNGYVFDLYRGFKWDRKETSFHLKFGESYSGVGFDKIKEIVFSEQGKSVGSLKSTAGSTVPVTVIYYEGNIGGEVEGFGPAYLSMRDVKSITISK